MKDPFESRVCSSLANHLVRVPTRDAAVQGALAQLRKSMPGTVWAIVHSRQEGEVEVHASAPVARVDLQHLLDRAVGSWRATFVPVYPAAPLMLGPPTWHAVETSEPFLFMLAVWCLPGATLPSEGCLEELAELAMEAFRIAAGVELRRLAACIDRETGLLNQAGLAAQWRFEHTRAHRCEAPYSVLSLSCAAIVVPAVQRQLRTADTLARIATDRFVLLLPRTPRAGAQALAERLRELGIDVLPLDAVPPQDSRLSA
jgi:hypothetical protein